MLKRSNTSPAAPDTHPHSATPLWKSWNGLVRHDYERCHLIESTEQLSEVVARASHVRPFGHRYSSSDICAGTEVLLDMTSYDAILSVDEERMEITVQAGITLKKLLHHVEGLGWAIPCLPDIDAVTLGGALATGTHGTGREGHILSQYMTRCRLVLPDGSVREVTDTDDLMHALRVSVGALGVMSEITLRCVPIYTLHLHERPMRDEEWVGNLEALHASHEFLRILWLPHTGHGYVITGDRIDPDTPIDHKPGPSWLKHRRRASRILYSNSWRWPWLTSVANKLLYQGFFDFPKEHKGTLYQATVTKKRSSTMKLAEWTIPRRLFPTVFTELRNALDDPTNSAYAHVPMDVRFLRRDESWLSYAYGEDCVTMGCVCRDVTHAEHYQAFEVMERIFLKHGGRPHWAKHFLAGSDTLATLYPKFSDFQQLRAQMDPTDKLLTPYLERILT